MTRYSKHSWINELKRKYDKLMNTQENEIMDKTNDVILEAIGRLDAINCDYRKKMSK